MTTIAHRLVEVGGGVDVDVAVADAGLDHRHRRPVDHGLDQPGAAPRDQHVDQAARRHQVAGRSWRRPRHQLDGSARQAGATERVLHDLDQALVGGLYADEEPRSSTALPHFRHSPAASTVTLGRAS